MAAFSANRAESWAAASPASLENRGPKRGRGLGGWLILPLLSLLAYPLLFVARVIPAFIQVRKAGGLEAVFVADPRWLALSLYDVVASAVIGGWALFALPGFLKKQKATVWRMQALYAALMLNNLVTYVLERLQADASASSTLPVFQLASPLLWIQYFNTSKRVKETFVR